MKKLLAFSLVLVLCLGGLSCGAFAAETVAISAVASADTVAVGDTVTVTVRLDDNPGVAAFSVELTASDNLQPVSMEQVGGFSDGTGMLNPDYGRMDYVALSEDTYTGDLFTVTYEAVASGTASFTFSETTFNDNDINTLSTTVSDMPMVTVTGEGSAVQSSVTGIDGSDAAAATEGEDAEETDGNLEFQNDLEEEASSEASDELIGDEILLSTEFLFRASDDDPAPMTMSLTVLGDGSLSAEDDTESRDNYQIDGIVTEVVLNLDGSDDGSSYNVEICLGANTDELNWAVYFAGDDGLVPVDAQIEIDNETYITVIVPDYGTYILGVSTAPEEEESPVIVLEETDSEPPVEESSSSHTALYIGGIVVLAAVGVVAIVLYRRFS